MQLVQSLNTLRQTVRTRSEAPGKQVTSHVNQCSVSSPLRDASSHLGTFHTHCERSYCLCLAFLITGVGLFFERIIHDGSLFPVVKDITEKGSAYREGSIKTGAIMLAVDGRSCRDMTLADLKNMVHDVTVSTHAHAILALTSFTVAPCRCWDSLGR